MKMKKYISPKELERAERERLKKAVDAESFATVLRNTAIKKGYLSFGSFRLDFEKGVSARIQYNRDNIDMLENSHEYTFHLVQGELQVSLQLYENVSKHYRLFAFAKAGNSQGGMLFSMNLTTEKEGEHEIYLTQKIRFSEGRNEDKETDRLKRRQKQILLCEIYRKVGFDITENNDLILGIFDPIDKKFVNTSAENFLNNFLVASILKGHFQGNKEYSLDILPDYGDKQLLFGTGEEKETLVLPKKIKKQATKRTIPLSLRYKVLKRDNSKCVVCGRGIDDNVILHVDHKIPYSLGGATTLENLQTLCSECNLGKGNRFIDS